jgi:signal transduction histidine kinase
MKGLIERFSSVPMGLDLKKRKVVLENFVHEAIKKIAKRDNKNVVLTCEIDDIPAINIDPHAVEMVLINLVNNAFEAIEDKGEIKIVVFKEGHYANIKISDNGKGMSKDFIESSLFKPFKSSKKSGFGIGLYQSKSVIDAHNGMLVFTSEEGVGTSFTVKLPIGN